MNKEYMCEMPMDQEGYSFNMLALGMLYGLKNSGDESKPRPKPRPLPLPPKGK